MGIFSRARVPTSVLDEVCDCRLCGDGGAVRVAKHTVVELREFEGEPHAVEVRNLDLVFCGVHYFAYEPMLRRQGFTVADDRR